MELSKLWVTLGVRGANEVNRAIDDTTTNTENSSNKMMNSLKRLGAVIISVFAIDRIKDFGVKIVQTAANVQAENAQFEASFKELGNEALAMFSRVGDASGIFANRLKVTGTKAFSQLKGAGLDANEALQKTETFLGLAADAAAYYDISLEDAEARIRSFLRGNVEAGDAIGLFTSESQRNSYAVEMYGEKWIKLSEAQKQTLMLKVAEDIYTQSGALGQASREAEGLANITGNLKEVWRQFLAVIGTPVLQFVTPIITTLTAKIQELQGKVEQLKVWISNNSETINRWKENILLAVQVIGGLVIALKATAIIGTITAGFREAQIALTAYTAATKALGFQSALLASTLTIKQTLIGLLTGQISITTVATNVWAAAQRKLNIALTANPIGVIIMLIAGLVAIIVTAYQKSETFRNAVNLLGSELKKTLQPVLEALKPLLSAIMELFRAIWNLISSLLVPIFKSLINSVSSLIKTAIPGLKSLFNTAKTVFSGIVKVVTPVIKVITEVINIITKAVNAVTGFVGKIANFFGGSKKAKIEVKGSSTSVQKFATGGIMKKPTVFDYNPSTDTAKLGGEAGDEVIAPLKTLLPMIGDTVRAENQANYTILEKIYNLLFNYLPYFNKLQIVLDSGALVGELAPAMDAKLGDIQTFRGRGN